MANSPHEYEVKKLESSVGKQYLITNHYSHGCHNGPICYGLFDKDELIGVLAFACPCSENVRRSVWGEELKDSVIELHRLHVMDGTPKNTESYFISRAIKLLKQDYPKYNGIISFADSTVGHLGTIYKASNFFSIGITNSSSTFYLDSTGRLRHPRQSGKNISKEEALSMGWTPVKRLFKYRYLYIIGNNKFHRKELIRTCKLLNNQENITNE